MRNAMTTRAPGGAKNPPTPFCPHPAPKSLYKGEPLFMAIFAPKERLPSSATLPLAMIGHFPQFSKIFDSSVCIKRPQTASTLWEASLVTPMTRWPGAMVAAYEGKRDDPGILMSRRALQKTNIGSPGTQYLSLPQKTNVERENFIHF